MAIQIKEIHVKNAGPIEKLSLKFGAFNLIFGRNEKGKTFLVEFLIHALFRNPRLWSLRKQNAKGKVIVAGLEKQPVAFGPDSGIKLEDFWDEETPGLPPDFSKLLVVKGAEPELSDAGGGIDKVILKNFLSSQGVLDHIEQNISKTIQESNIEDDRVIGPKRKEIKEREQLESELKEINQLFHQVDKIYSGGKRKILLDEKNRIHRECDQIDQARRYLAFQIDREYKQLEKQKNRISEEKMREIRELFRLYKQRIEDYKLKKNDQEASEKRSRHHEWLASASNVYETILNKEDVKPRPIFLILSGLCVLSAGILIYLQILYGALGSLLGVLLFGYLYFRKVHASTRKEPEKEELKRLEIEYKARFGEDLTGLPLLRERLHHMEEDYSKSRLLTDQLYSDLRSIEVMKIKISDQISELTGESKPPEDWDAVLKSLEEKIRSLNEAVQEKRIRLAQLGVDSSDYVTDEPGVEYSKQQYEALLEKQKRIEQEIEEENQKLDSLKRSIYQHARGEARNWEMLIDNLRVKRETLREAYKQKTAEIVGKVLVHKVLENLQKDESIKISQGLQSMEVLEPLQQITKRYEGFKLSGESLMVSDSYHDFPVADLSTGAREQVLLALRIGFSRKLLKENNLFFILDDAFQYSDWVRRENLMDTIVRLAKSGWQIIYFTMDDHIRDLFQKRGKAFKEDYRYYELDA